MSGPKDFGDRRCHHIEVWGGVECTVNRVGETYHDQLERSGHAWRIGDIDRFHALGLQALRFPCLWERTAPDGPHAADWRWLDARLARMRRLGMRVIAGLVHHGSGPRSTSLLDDSFADGLAAYALAFARRYPWVDAYTPVNEPNTTARFSALYGHWYPHARSDAAYCRALLVQCRAVVGAMQAVRSVHRGARLIQTDDAGLTRSTAPLAAQADFETERRWLAWDLVAGRVDERHPLRGWLLRCGVSARRLDWFRDNACPADIVGVNYYVTSDRYLDHDTARHPPHTHGGNGRDSYADVEAVRMPEAALAGHEAVLADAYARYGRPVALTEVHLGCTREEQVRWLASAWRGACAAYDRGVDVRAICAWALLGSHDWSTLVTRAHSSYEPGAFDVRSATPRPTAIATAVRDIVRTGDVQHPLLAVDGWWRRDSRVLGRGAPSRDTTASDARPVLVTGGSGRLALAFTRRCVERGLPVRALDRAALDAADAQGVTDAVARLRPWAIINAAGFSDVDAAECRPADCWRDNVTAVEVLCQVAAAAGVPLLTFSSGLVFDGELGRAYVEGDRPAPLSVFAATKVAAERIVARSGARVLVVRTGPMFSTGDEKHFIGRGLRALQAGRRWRVAGDETYAPTYVPHLVDAALDLLIDGEYGVWHVTNVGSRTPAALATELAVIRGFDARLIEACPSATLRRAARRPRQSVLESARGVLLPPLEQALQQYVSDAAAPMPGLWHAASGEPCA